MNSNGRNMVRACMALALAQALALALAACNESDPGLGSDTSTDSLPDVVVSSCDLVTGWSLSVDEGAPGTGTVGGLVTLDSGGTTSSCAGAPCMVVTVISGGGTVSGITQDSTNTASFTYTNADLAPGTEAQLLLRWRVMCTSTSGTNEERTVSLPVKVCSGTTGTLSLVTGTCP